MAFIGQSAPDIKKKLQRLEGLQDLREVNKRVLDIHPTVPNPYNLLSSLPPERTWYTVLDLKDAFFCLCLHPRVSSCLPLNGGTQRADKLVN